MFSVLCNVKHTLTCNVMSKPGKSEVRLLNGTDRNNQCQNAETGSGGQCWFSKMSSLVIS